MTQQLPLAGPQKIECPCGACGLFGTPRRRVWRGEAIGHVAKCPCAKCRGSRVKKNSGNRERRIAKVMGLERSYGSGIFSGFDLGGSVIIEETSAESVIRGVRRWLVSKGVSDKFSRLYSLPRTRPKVRLLSWDGKPQVGILDFEDLLELVQLASMDRRGISPEKLRQTIENLIQEAS